MKQTAFDAGRIGALSDGVFAIAMTLLVLDLKLPDLGQGLDREAFADVLMEQGPRFMSWLISFAVLCRLWISHHALLTEGERRSRGFIGWSFLFLGAVSFTPFPTSLLSEHHDQPLSVVIFSVTLAVAGIALLGMYRSLLRERPTRGRASRSHVWPAVVLLVTALVAGALAVFKPVLGFLVWVAFPIIVVVIEQLILRARKRSNR